MKKTITDSYDVMVKIVEHSEEQQWLTYGVKRKQ